MNHGFDASAMLRDTYHGPTLSTQVEPRTDIALPLVVRDDPNSQRVCRPPDARPDIRQVNSVESLRKEWASSHERREIENASSCREGREGTCESIELIGLRSSQTMMHSKRDSAPTLFSILRETPPFPLQDDIPESSSRKAPCDKSRHKYQSLKPVDRYEDIPLDVDALVQDIFDSGPSSTSKRPVPSPPRRTDQSDLIDFLHAGPPTSYPPAVFSGPSTSQASSSTSRNVFSFFSIKRPTTLSRASSRSSPADPVRVLPPRPSMSGPQLELRAGPPGKAPTGSVLGRSRTREENQQSVKGWEAWTESLNGVDLGPPPELSMSCKASRTPSFQNLVDVNIVDPSSPASSSFPSPLPARSDSISTTSSGPNFFQFALTRIPTTSGSTAPSSAHSLPFSDLHVTSPAAIVSPFAGLRSRFVAHLPRTLLDELFATLALFRDAYLASTCPQPTWSPTSSIVPLEPTATKEPTIPTFCHPLESADSKELAFFQSELRSICKEIEELIPPFGHILRQGCIGGYGPLSSERRGWGLASGEHLSDGTWWCERLRRDLEAGLLISADRGRDLLRSSTDNAVSGRVGRVTTWSAWGDRGEEVFGGESEESRALREEGRRRNEAWKAGLGVQSVT